MLLHDDEWFHVVQYCDLSSNLRLGGTTKRLYHICCTKISCMHHLIIVLAHNMFWQHFIKSRERLFTVKVENMRQQYHHAALSSVSKPIDFSLHTLYKLKPYSASSNANMKHQFLAKKLNLEFQYAFFDTMHREWHQFMNEERPELLKNYRKYLLYVIGFMSIFFLLALTVTFVMFGLYLDGSIQNSMFMLPLLPLTLYIPLFYFGWIGHCWISKYVPVWSEFWKVQLHHICLYL